VHIDREQIIKDFVRRKWNPRTVEVWHRARLKCKYCGKSLTSSPGDYYHAAHVDHITPGDGDSLDNLALACIACNRIKRKKRYGEGVEGAPLPRSELIRLAAVSIAAIRERDEKRLAADLELFRLLARS
jgi:5-methylcytosine-specific restriction endonuclease McrA